MLSCCTSRIQQVELTLTITSLSMDVFLLYKEKTNKNNSANEMKHSSITDSWAIWKLFRDAARAEGKKKKKHNSLARCVLTIHHKHSMCALSGSLYKPDEITVERQNERSSRGQLISRAHHGNVGDNHQCDNEKQIGKRWRELEAGEGHGRVRLRL